MKHSAAEKKFGKEVRRYLSLFEAAFDELHDIVTKEVKTPGKHVGPHHDYPDIYFHDSGFPSFREVGFYADSAPRDYVGTIRPTGLIGLMRGYQRPRHDFPKGIELADFLRSHEIGNRLKLERFVYDGVASNFLVDRLVGDAVERYLHLHGLDAPIEAKRRSDILRPLLTGTVVGELDLRLVVPVTMTHFEVDHFRLSDTTYITRLPRKVQLARGRMSTSGSGAVRNVVGAATHAFVSKGWQLDVDDIIEVSDSLGQSSASVEDAIDSFFGALGIATGFSNGYAQILWMPRHWALEYFCDLPPMYGTTLRKYPSEYDDYGWTRRGETVTTEQLHEVRRIYQAIVDSKSEAVRLALKRLNGCFTRSDAADAILDGTIGLELLLGDDESQSLSYKLRLRAGALAILQADPSLSADQIFSKVKRLYSARSAIVHGRRKKRSKMASETADTSHAGDRLLASDLLRFVLDVLLTHPKYQSPAEIDEGLLLRGNDTASAKPKATPRRNRRRKKN